MLPVLNRRRSEMPQPSAADWDLDHLVNRWFSDFPWPAAYSSGYPVDIFEDDDHVYVEAEMPGFKKDEINVTFEQGILSISAEHSGQSDTGDGGKRHLRERKHVRYQRFFTLPTAVDDQKVEARLEDGVLYLTFPKAAEVKPRRIAVK